MKLQTYATVNDQSLMDVIRKNNTISADNDLSKIFSDSEIAEMANKNVLSVDNTATGARVVVSFVEGTIELIGEDEDLAGEETGKWVTLLIRCVNPTNKTMHRLSVSNI